MATLFHYIKNCTFALLFVVILALFSCSHPTDVTKETHASDSTTTSHQPSVSQEDTIVEAGKDDDKIYNLIYALTEVKERADYIEQQTSGNRHLKLMITERPQNEEQNYYLVKAGEDNDISFVTHFSFYVYPTNNYEIKYYDPVKDTLISINKWRKENKQFKTIK